jgi:serine phosphatase RsbU (regulator of sigma subunit)
MGDSTKALEYFFRSLNIRLEIDNKRGVASSYGNIGGIYWDMGDIPMALNYYNKSLKIFEEIGHKNGIANALKNIGDIKYDNGDLREAQNYALRSLAIAEEIGYPEYIGSAANLLSRVYEKEEKGMDALHMYRMYIQMRDSINNEETQKANARQQAKFAYEKQKTIDDAEHEKRLAIEQEEKEKQQIISYAIATVLVLSILFLYFVFNRLKITRRQKNQIEEQKIEVEKQRDVIRIAHKEITDSITYAKRIQNAILPPARIVKEYLEDSFILYNPKDVVAGDFYWMRHIDDKILFAAADCTGHGVPGAMVSVVCNNALNRSVRDYGLSEPGKILDMTREIVIREFEKSDEEVQDGMDIALCMLEGKTLQFAGAYNPLWIIRDGELMDIKANRWPIGLTRNPQPFTTHTIHLQKNDVLYIFTDGFVDQFGGAEGKKFKSQNFKNLLLSIYDKPMAVQRDIIYDTFIQWKGKLEQVDDICIIGARV